MSPCLTCGGVGLIGGHSGQTPESYEEWGEPCPECSALDMFPTPAPEPTEPQK
jgi:hypothetical protein